MNGELHTDTEIKRVGKSGQISLGKEHAGQYFREERRSDGTIILVPVVVLPRSHWSVRDQEKIRNALVWSARNPAAETDLERIVKKAKRPVSRRKRGR